MNPTPANSRDSRIASAVRCLIRLPVSKLATVFGETLAFVANSLMVISSRARPARHCAAIIFRPYQNARHRPPKRSQGGPFSFKPAQAGPQDTCESGAHPKQFNGIARASRLHSACAKCKLTI